MEFIYLTLIMMAGAIGMAYWLKLLGPQKTASPLITDEPDIDKTIEAYFASLRKVPPNRTATRKRFIRFRAGAGTYCIEDTTSGKWYSAGANHELAEELVRLLNEAKNPIVTQPEPNVIVVNWNDHVEGDEHIWIDTFNFNK